MIFNRFFVLCCFLFAFCLSQGHVDGLVAVVGKNIVLHSDVLQQAQFSAYEQDVDPSKSPYLFENIYYQTLDNIISQLAVLDVAEKDTNLFISNDDVDKNLNQRIDEFVARAGSEESFLTMVGMSMRQVRSDYWKDIKNMMMIEKFQYSKIQNLDVSRKEVINFYNTYKDSLPVLPEEYDFSVIEIPFISSSSSDALIS